MRKRTKTAMRKEADALFSKLVRSRGICEAQGQDGIACSQSLQTMHIIPRRYLSVRWDEDNALSGCGAHHAFYTHFPLEFTMFLGRKIGAEKYQELSDRALKARGAPDYESVLRRLKGSVAA